MKKSLSIAMAACAVLSMATARHLPSAAAQKAAISTAGVYIASASFPLASGGGEVKLSQ